MFRPFKWLASKICDTSFYCIMIFYCVFRYPKAAQEIIQAYEMGFKRLIWTCEEWRVDNEQHTDKMDN